MSIEEDDTKRGKVYRLVFEDTEECDYIIESVQALSSDGEIPKCVKKLVDYMQKHITKQDKYHEGKPTIPFFEDIMPYVVLGLIISIPRWKTKKCSVL